MLILCYSLQSVAQTGPGGVGNATGANSQPINVLWLRGDAGVSTSGSLVDTWADQSGNSNNATGAGVTRPTFNGTDANFNSLPSVTFPNTAASNFFLQVADNDNLDNTNNLSVFVVSRPITTTTINGLLSKRSAAATDQSYFFEITNALRYRATIATGATSNMVSVNATASQANVLSFIMNGSTRTGLLNGGNSATPASASSIPNATSNLFIGSYDAITNNNFEGEISEVIIFRSTLNLPQRQLIENYLSAKYNITLVGGADFYGGDVAGTPTFNHDFDLAGFGQQGGEQHTIGNSRGFIVAPANGTLNADAEYVMAAHNGVTNSAVTTNLGTGGVVQRWNRTWYIDKTTAGTLDADLTFDFSEGISGQFPQNKDNYVLLRLNISTGNYDVVSGITSGDKTISGDQISFRVTDTNLIDGVYTLGTLDLTNSPVTGVSNRTWYSYQSGNWTDPLSWTLDGGITPLFVNPSNEVPSLTDNVIVTSGRTITMNTNNVQINSMQVIGTLDLAATTGHNFINISGNGRIRLSGSTDNFPAGSVTSFADNSIGGTVEFYGSGKTLSSNRTLNNVVVNMTGSTDLLTLVTNFTINGNLTIENGLFRINDNSTLSNFVINIFGNVTVNASGGIRVGNTASNTRHEFNLYGNFVNDGGTAYFTNRTSANFTADDNTGFADFNTLNATRDQQILCNGETRFSRIEINKGLNDTYKTTLSASTSSNFNLFGRSNFTIDTDQATTNENALGLIYGTVELGTNVSVTLNTSGNLAIYEGAQLWVNGATVTKTGNTAIVPYGRLRVSAGNLTADVTGGITTRENGIIQVDGGTITTRQIRTSTAGVSSDGSYIQTGGDVVLTGNDVSDEFAVFSLTYPGNVFNMSGGTLTIQSANNLGTASTRGSVFINSDPANVSITGGTVIFEADQAVTYRITSRATFWNAIFRATGGSRTFQLLGTTSGQGGGEVTLGIQPLTVLNDLTIENNATFETNNANITLGGSFEIANGGIYTHGSNTTTFNGIGVASITLGNTTTTQTFNNLVINKNSSSDEVVIAAGRAAPNAAIQVNGTFTVTRGLFDYGAFRLAINENVSLSSGVTVGRTSSTGRLVFGATVDQTISTLGATIVSMEINKTTANRTVSLASGNLTITGTLTLTDGVFNINTRRLTFNGASAAISGTGYSTTKMIQMAGNAGDGGLEMYFNANETIVYPIGTNANSSVRYSPVTATTQSFADDGLIRISIEDRLLQLANLPATNSLSYNWRANHSNFTTLPRISYQFTYDQTDADGSEASYVPGKVLTGTPFTRSSEDGTDINTTTNVLTFNGTTTGGGFPGAGFTLENAAYTGGSNGMFTGTPETYYNLNTGQLGWEDNNKWSLISHTGSATNQSPGPGDIAIVRNFGEANGNAWIIMDVDVEVAAVIFDNTGGGWSPRITVQNGRTVSLGVVSGTGTIMVEANGSLPNLTTTDIGNFARQDASVFIYKVENNATYDLYTSFTEYPNLRIEGNDGSNNNGLRVMTNPNPVTINRDLWMDWGGTFRAGNTVTIVRDMLPGAGGGGGGRFQFGEGGNYIVNVGRDLTSNNSANNRVEVLNTTPSTRLHTLRVSGNITLNTGLIDLYSGAGATDNQVSLELISSTNGSFTNASGNTPDLFRIVMNKGNSIATTFTLTDNVTLNGPFDAATKPLTLQNGLLIMDDAALNFTLTSGGADFYIPGTSGLEVRQGTAATSTTSTNANIVLDGLLRVSGGTLSVNGGTTTDTNYIEYTNSGNASIEITSGTLTVAGQVRRQLTSDTGVLRFTQSGGTFTVGNESATTTSRGVFEVLNSGSLFNHSGGTFTVVRGINSTTIPSIWLEPTTSTVTAASTINVGSAATPSGVNALNIGLRASATLNNLVVNGVNSPVVRLYSLPLTLNGSLTVNTSNTFDANGLNLTIRGNMTVDGSYIPNGNTTFFTNTAAAVVSGATPLFNFFNFSKSGAGTLTVSKNITINKDLTVTAGTVAHTGFDITLIGNAALSSNFTSTSGNGLIFAGSTQQQLTRNIAGTTTLGIVTINNTNGVVIPDGNGFNFTINNGLRMQRGVWDIGSSLLTLNSSALITAVNPFSVTNLIQTNSSFTDFGVRKIFPTNFNAAIFVFPVGQLAYTPVTFNFVTPNTTGSNAAVITVRPANERHPSIVQDDELPLGAGPEDFDDHQNSLQYHWIINADNITNTNFRSTMTLQYDQSVVAVTAPRTEADYIPARILSDNNASNSINKFTTADLDEASNTITFDFSSVTDAGISGEYFAGVDLAIPDNVPTYRTTGSGNVNAAIYTPAVPGGGAPTGAQVIIEPGHNVTFNINNVSLYETTISAGATLTIPTGSIGHRLGTLTGTGDLRVESNTTSLVLPAAVYDDFFSCSGGGLIFGGSGSYEILGGIPSLRNLTILGSGAKTFANNDVTICNDLTVNMTSGSLSIINSRTINVQNDVIINNAGALNTLTGNLNITRDLIQSAGTFNGGTGGTKAVGRNINVTGGTFNTGTGVGNLLEVAGNMTVADAATFTTGTASATGQVVLFDGTSQQTLTGNFTNALFSFRAFNRLEINNATGLILAGNVTINAELGLTNGLITPGTNTVLLGLTAIATPTLGSLNSFVNGKLFKVINNGTFNFPIGRTAAATNRWRPGALFNTTGGTRTWDMEYIPGAATGAVANAPAPRNNPVNNFTSADPLILRIATGEHWRVSDGSGTSNGRTARVGLSWGTASDVSAIQSQRESMKVMTWNGTNWTNSGGQNFSVGHTQSAGTFQSVSTLSFSENIVTLGSTEVANPLPVELLSFTGFYDNGVNIIEWKTATEIDNDFFELQRSVDGETFEVIGIVKGVGTTTDLTRYNYRDNKPVAGNNYYRLRQVDFNGQFEYSEVTKVMVDENAFVFNINPYPNPVNRNTKLTTDYLKSNDEDAVVLLRDLTGKVMEQAFVNGTTGTVEFNIDNKNPGMYLVEMQQGERKIVKKIIVN
ncbi:MAG: T9SS type A sorting domain-containing protein [Chryseotalea sp.]